MTTDNKHYMFVYGSLKQGHGNNLLLNTSDFLSEGITTNSNFNMYSFGGFPGVFETRVGRVGGHHVVGEVYIVNDEVLEILDKLEGNGVFYQRRLVEVYCLGGFYQICWMYILLVSEQETIQETINTRILIDPVENTVKWV